jgi:hypothetical protein
MYLHGVWFLIGLYSSVPTQALLKLKLREKGTMNSK